MGDNDEYRMAIFSGRLEDWDAWKRDVESFIGAKDPEMADIIVGLIKKPSSLDELSSYKEKNAKGYFTLKKYLRGAAANLIEKFRLDKDGAGAFSMKDLKELDWILGMAIKRNREKRVMEISQTAYIDMVLKKFGMTGCKPVLTPMEGILTKTNDREIKPDNEYMKLVGS